MFGLIALLILAPAIYLVVACSKSWKGKWGLNFRRGSCSSCGEPVPLVRIPTSFHQMMWGGSTCRRCGTEHDKWGCRINGPSANFSSPQNLSHLIELNESPVKVNESPASPVDAEPAASTVCQFLIARAGKESGPFSEEQILSMLRSGLIDPTNMGWKEGMTEWRSLSSLFNVSVDKAPVRNAAPGLIQRLQKNYENFVPLSIAGGMLAILLLVGVLKLTNRPERKSTSYGPSMYYSSGPVVPSARAMFQDESSSFGNIPFVSSGGADYQAELQARFGDDFARGQREAAEDQQRASDRHGEMTSRYQKCGKCNGVGLFGRERCSACGGIGKVAQY